MRQKENDGIIMLGKESITIKTKRDCGFETVSKRRKLTRIEEKEELNDNEETTNNKQSNNL